MTLRMVTLTVPGDKSNLWWEFRIRKEDKSNSVLAEELNQSNVRLRFTNKLAEFRGSPIVIDEFQVMKAHVNPA